MPLTDCAFETPRLLVKEWHSLTPDEWRATDLSEVVAAMLTPAVTQTLPEPWQGDYTPTRASDWVRERDAEGVTLLAIDKSDGERVGLVILAIEDDPTGGSIEGASLRLGYLLAEASWGQGFASELVTGLVAWCRERRVGAIAGGVDEHNAASIRVLEKNGFELQPGAEVGPGELLYRLVLAP